MKRILILIAFLTIADISARPYETAQRFDEGDVVSAEVINDILDRIELALKDISRSEMIGTWEISAYLCSGSRPDKAVTEQYGCVYNFPAEGMDGVESMENGLYAKRVDTWTITGGSGDRFNIASTNFNSIFDHTVTPDRQDLNDGNTHSCVMVSGQAMMACELDFSAIQNCCDDGGANYKMSAYFNVQRLSETRIKLFWGPQRGSGTFNIIIMDKTDIPPSAPTALSASVSGNASEATVTLSWTINGEDVTGGEVKRKLAFDGAWSTLGTPDNNTYSDTDIALNNSYWYRVFATNANGSSIGSNVVKINWYNTLPSINIPSVISVNENQSSNSEFTRLLYSDADGQPLTLTLDSQAPGNDATNFTLASDGGLSFNVSPDYENPADYDSDNIYDLKLSASDGIESVSQDFSVVVLNVSE